MAQAGECGDLRLRRRPPDSALEAAGLCLDELTPAQRARTVLTQG